MPNVHIQKPFKSGSHRNPHNRELQAKKTTLVLDALDKSPRRDVETSVGTFHFENGLAVLPNDGRGNEVAAELREKSLDPNAVVEVRHRESMLPHRRREASQSFHTVPALPWKRGEKYYWERNSSDE